MNRQQRRAAARQGAPQAAPGPAVAPGIADMFASGVAHHQGGRLPQAEACYRQVLAIQPDHADTLHLLGVIAYQVGRHDVAIDLIRRAIARNAGNPAFFTNLSNALRDQGKLEAAVEACRAAIRVDPNFAEAHCNLGTALSIQGKLDEAADSYRQAIRINAGFADAYFNLGNVLRLQGRLDEAVAACRQAIRINPGSAKAHSNLGAALSGQGNRDEAIAACREAIRIAPNFVEAYAILGTALRESGKPEEAVAACRHAVRLKPDEAGAHRNLGHALRDQGKLDEAVASFRDAVRIKSDDATAHSNLGGALFEQGKFDEAVAAYREAIRLKPDFAAALCNLGVALADQMKLDEAVDACRQAVAIKPDLAEAHLALGTALRKQGNLDEAVAAYGEADRIKPNHADTLCNLGCALLDQRKLEAAAAVWLQAIRVKPDHAEAHGNLGNALRETGRLDEAVAACRHAIRIKPDNANVRLNLGAALADQGKLDEALATYREAIQIKADFVSASSGLAFCMNYTEKASVDELFDAHREWNERHGQPLPRPAAHDNERSPRRQLKVGYVSPDFRGHSVAYFLEPLLQNHDRNAVEVFCYAEVSWPDAATRRFERLTDHWTKTVGMSDEALAQRIRSDGIDILVDLAGHTAKNRLPLFVRKPAPVQVTWLGYPNTTGLDAIDYRLVDAVTDPEGEADAFASETLLRLPGGFLCYGAPNDAPTPETAPCLATGFVTFGSFNSPAKLSAATLDAWAQVLIRLPTARLLLKGKPFADAATRALYIERLAERGIAAERLELMGWLPDSKSHLALYDRVDIALDPFPYNGTTTTCEALWMGVPVVTLRGDRHAGRVGASLLTRVGLTDLIADSVEAYVATTVALAGNPARLADLRRSLRPRMAASSLCDAAGFARKVEDAYRTMWVRWCAATALPSG
jgi:protein O-GlcNAc transferase